MQEIEFKCPAKLNLFLEVLGRRADGYHEIETLFLPVGLYDTVSFKKKASGTEIFCDSPSIPSGEENIVHKAVTFLSRGYGFGGGLEVRIRKRIPAGSGMGGGSSDAAAALAACSALFSLGLSKAELIRAGAGIGADVPFFLSLLDEGMSCFSGGAFRGRGRGDVLEYAGDLSGLKLVVVEPGFALSTGEVYGRLNLTGKRRDIRMILEAVERGSPAEIASRLFNRLEEAAEKINPVVKEIKADLLGAGAPGALMTGSGSAVFGIARDQDSASSIREKILSQRKGGNAHVISAL